MNIVSRLFLSKQGIGLKILIGLIGLMILPVFFMDKEKSLRAERGSIELSTWNPASLLPLTGEWYFFPNEILQPEDFLLRFKRGSTLRYAETGRSIKSLVGKDFNPEGQLASYVLHLKNVPDIQGLALGLAQIYSYSRTFIFSRDGQLGSNSPFEIGKFAEGTKSSQVAIGSGIATVFPEELTQNEAFILIQIGNQIHGGSVIWMAPMIGLSEELAHAATLFERWNNVFRGLLLFTIMYHTMFYFHHRKDKGSIYLALFCLCFLLQNILLESYVRHFTKFFNAEHEIATRGVYAMLILNSLAFLSFIHNYFPKQLSIRHLKLSAVSIIILVIGHLALPFLLITSHWYSTALLIAIFPAIALQAILRAYLTRETGANFALYGFIFMMLMLLIDAGQTLGFTFWFMPDNVRIFFSIAGVGGFVAFQSQVIAERFALALRTADHLTRFLNSEVEQQTLELRQHRDLLASQQEKLKLLHRHTLQRFLPPMLVNDIMEGRAHLHEESMSRDITVMFADLCSFTSATEKLGPQIITQILNEYLRSMTEVVFDQQGTIDKFIGDGILILFGTPKTMPSEEQISRAIECAQNMQSKLAELNRSWSIRYKHNFSMRIGIHYGPAIVGYFGGSQRSDYTAIGQTVNIAARVEPLAGPGQILVTGAVIRYLSPGTYQSEGSFSLKGIHAPIELYRVHEQKAA